MNSFIKQLQRRVLLFDGATGTSLQNQNLSAEDFGGEELEGCNEYLCISNPDAVRKVHYEFLQAGADIIETNSFGATSIVLGEYNIADRAYELSRLSTEIARACANEYSTEEWPRFVAGSIGPTTKLPSLEHISFDDMEASYYDHICGLIDGGADLLCIETCQDPLQVKTALAATMRAFEEKGVRLPVIVSVTIEMIGTMLMGTEIAAALTTFEPYDIISVFGLNCATGPKEMEEHIMYLSANSPKPIFVMPNAGIPENVGGVPHYHLTPEEMEKWMKKFVGEFGVGVIGGCCGTTPAHISRLRTLIDTTARAERNPEFVPSVSSIYQSVPMRVEPAPLLVGERCNANGSKKFKRLLAEDNYDGMVAMAKEQMKEGAHVLDVCVAYVGRDEGHDADEVMRRFNTTVQLPLVIDSTEVPVIEIALKRYAGRAIINSINFEDGTEKAQQIIDLAKRYGAALIALSIDESGQAYTLEQKVGIARRIRDFVVEENGMRESDLIFDPLTFTLGTGQEELRDSGSATIEAIRQIKANMPDAKTILGLSNCSFGLNPAARQVLNSVFLYHAVEAGLDMAIVHASKIQPLNRLDEEGAEIARKLIYDEREWEEVE
ncbi:MAG: homocysteine S-methyltransferase family protein [Ignavibacteriae bacterium]|nr:homocysteine S-methyltransferase family protein [Ignavibacteriota bacterium]MCB9215779.1 homocysteine S-methyltransferase family protein [Ignavibacteria bacterium]